MKPKGEWTSMRRKDLGLLILVGFLFAALTFNLGLYWGVKWGLGNGSLAVTPQQGHHGAPAHAPEHGEVIEAKAAAPTQTEEDWHTKKEIPEVIREAFVKSKQSALIEMQLRAKDRVPVGTSIADVDTFFREKQLKWGEAPKSEEKVERSVASVAPAKVVAVVKKEAAPGLFERAPASVKEFKPIPGQKTIQIASYATEEEAIARVKLLIEGGMSDAYYTKTKVHAETWYQVSVGSFADAAWAKKIGDRMVRRSIASEFFVRSIPD